MGEFVECVTGSCPESFGIAVLAVFAMAAELWFGPIERDGRNSNLHGDLERTRDDTRAYRKGAFQRVCVGCLMLTVYVLYRRYR